MEEIVFIGANNPETARMMNAVMQKQRVNFAGFLDNDVTKKNTLFAGLPVFGGFEYLDEMDKQRFKFVNLITRDCATRYETSQFVFRKGFAFTNFIHPSVDLMLVRSGVGNYIQEGVIIQAEVELGNNLSIHMGSLIGHESKIGSSSFVAHGVVISGRVSVADGVFIGAGAVVLPRLSIGEWSIVGAGSVITKDVPPMSVVAGNPARVIRTFSQTYSSGDPFSCDTR